MTYPITFLSAHQREKKNYLKLWDKEIALCCALSRHIRDCVQHGKNANRVLEEIRKKSFGDEEEYLSFLEKIIMAIKTKEEWEPSELGNIVIQEMLEEIRNGTHPWSWSEK